MLRRKTDAINNAMEAGQKKLMEIIASQRLKGIYRATAQLAEKQK